MNSYNPFSRKCLAFLGCSTYCICTWYSPNFQPQARSPDPILTAASYLCRLPLLCSSMFPHTFNEFLPCIFSKNLSQNALPNLHHMRMQQTCSATYTDPVQTSDTKWPTPWQAPYTKCSRDFNCCVQVHMETIKKNRRNPHLYLGIWIRLIQSWVWHLPIVLVQWVLKVLQGNACT